MVAFDLALAGPVWQHLADYEPGGALAVRPRLALTEWMDLEPGLGVVASPALAGVTGFAEAGVRLHAVGDEAVPWFGLSAMASADGLGFDAGAGLALDAGGIRIGPFARYLQGLDPGLLLVGLQVESRAGRTPSR